MTTTMLGKQAIDAMAANVSRDVKEAWGKPMKDVADALRPALADVNQQIVDAVTKVAFTDAAGTEWPITLTVWTYKRCKDAGFALPGTAADIPAIGAVLEDAEKLAEVLWLVCEPDAANEKKAGFLDRHAPPLTKDEFLARLNGEVLNAAGFALTDAVIHFTIPRPGPRELYKRKYREHAAEAEQQLVDAMSNAPAVAPAVAPTEPNPE